MAEDNELDIEEARRKLEANVVWENRAVFQGIQKAMPCSDDNNARGRVKREREVTTAEEAGGQVLERLVHTKGAGCAQPRQ